MPIEPSDEEQRYFHAVEAETRRKLRETLDRNAKHIEDARKIAQTVGTTEETIAARVKELGFDGETAAVFDLLPLVHVAWADGAVQKGERATILEILKARGIEPGSQAFLTMECLLEERPSDAFMRQTREVLRDILIAKADRTDEILDLCMKVAAASGGFLGLGRRISDEEKKLIAQVSLALGVKANDKIKSEIG